MDEMWERAVEAALEGSEEAAAPRSLTLDGAVKCIHGRLPPPALLERFQSLEHLSITNVGVSSLEMFPRLPNLQRLSLSDNRIAGGLEFLVEAGLDSLRDLDLSNNRITSVEDLSPLARLRLVSLDLYECPVTRVKDYRLLVFAMIRSLKYLDKMDADENERPESDEEEDEDDEEEEDEDEDDDPGVGEIDGQEHRAVANGTVGNNSRASSALDVDEDEESDADEETDGIVQVGVSGSDHLANGFRVAPTRERDVEEDEEEVEVEYEDDSDDDLGEEIDEEIEDDVTEVQEIDDSDEDEGDGDDDEGDEDIEDEVDDDEDEELEDDAEPGSSRRFASSEGEIDGHEQGEDDENDEDDENGEIGEEDEQGIGDDKEFEDEEDDGESEYLMQPVPRPMGGGGNLGGCSDNEGEGDGEEDGVEDEGKECGVNGCDGAAGPPSSSQTSKRKREQDGVLDDEHADSRRTSKQAP